MNALILWLAQGFGVGRIPFAPGTFGSVVGIGWFLLLLLPGNPWVFVGGTIFGLAISVWLCGAAEKILGKTDPGSVVMDEITAMPVCLGSLAGLSCWHYHRWPMCQDFFSVSGWIWIFVTFVLFRVFDIWKPWPVRQSQKLPGGWGVTVDDVLAAVYVSVAVFVIWFGLFRRI